MDDDRRAFLKKLAERSLTVAGVGVAAAGLAHEGPRMKRAWRYVKPAVKSFTPQTTVYAQTTGAGKFTLKGTS